MGRRKANVLTDLARSALAQAQQQALALLPRTDSAGSPEECSRDAFVAYAVIHYAERQALEALIKPERKVTKYRSVHSLGLLGLSFSGKPLEAREAACTAAAQSLNQSFGHEWFFMVSTRDEYQELDRVARESLIARAAIMGSDPTHARGRVYETNSDLRAFVNRVLDDRGFARASQDEVDDALQANIQIPGRTN